MRITPAHAGNTWSRLSRSLVSGDHPRTCGEHYTYDLNGKRCKGSPPHMRGTPASEAAAEKPAGITPAHAGNTAHRDCRFTLPEDHPRTCGEHGISHSEASPTLGSPPHMRGTLTTVQKADPVQGITPAHAGNTFIFSCHGVVTGGSPPHMRGTRCT